MGRFLSALAVTASLAALGGGAVYAKPAKKHKPAKGTAVKHAKKTKKLPPPKAAPKKIEKKDEKKGKDKPTDDKPALPLPSGAQPPLKKRFEGTAVTVPLELVNVANQSLDLPFTLPSEIGARERARARAIEARFPPPPEAPPAAKEGAPPSPPPPPSGPGFEILMRKGRQDSIVRINTETEAQAKALHAFLTWEPPRRFKGKGKKRHLLSPRPRPGVEWLYDEFAGGVREGGAVIPFDSLLVRDLASDSIEPAPLFFKRWVTDGAYKEAK